MKNNLRYVILVFLLFSLPASAIATDSVNPDTYLWTLVYESVDEYGTVWKKYEHITTDTEETESEILNRLDEQAELAGRTRGRHYYIVGVFVSE